MTFVLTLDAILLKYRRTLFSGTILVKGVSNILTVALKWCIKRCFHRFSFKKLKQLQTESNKNPEMAADKTINKLIYST